MEVNSWFVVNEGDHWLDRSPCGWLPPPSLPWGGRPWLLLAAGCWTVLKTWWTDNTCEQNMVLSILWSCLNKENKRDFFIRLQELQTFVAVSDNHRQLNLTAALKMTHDERRKQFFKEVLIYITFSLLILSIKLSVCLSVSETFLSEL